MKSVNWPKPGYASITCSTISNIPYNLIFTTKFNDSSILITIISCDYLNLSWRMNTLVMSQYQPRLSSITKKPIRLKYSNQIKLLTYVCIYVCLMTYVCVYIHCMLMTYVCGYICLMTYVRLFEKKNQYAGHRSCTQ